jgi:hypothetical protein
LVLKCLVRNLRFLQILIRQIAEEILHLRYHVVIFHLRQLEAHFHRLLHSQISLHHHRLGFEPGFITGVSPIRAFSA